MPSREAVNTNFLLHEAVPNASFYVMVRSIMVRFIMGVDIYLFFFIRFLPFLRFVKIKQGQIYHTLP